MGRQADRKDSQGERAAQHPAQGKLAASSTKTRPRRQVVTTHSVNPSAALAGSREGSSVLGPFAGDTFEPSFGPQTIVYSNEH